MKCGLPICLLLLSVSLSLSIALSSCPGDRSTVDLFRTTTELLTRPSGLDSLSSLANTLRSQFFGNTLDYKDLRTAIALIYNGTTSFRLESFLSFSFWLDILLVAVLVLVVAVALPLLLILLWLYWAYCIVPSDGESQSDEEEEEEEDEGVKYTSKASQAVICCAGLSIVISLMLLAVFAIILFIGAERISQSVSTSAGFVNHTLPLIVRLHNEVLTTVHRHLSTDVIPLNHSIYSEHIYPFGDEIVFTLNSSFYNNITEIFKDISLKTSQLEKALSLSSDLYQFQQTLDSFLSSSFWNDLNNDLTSLVQMCDNITATADPSSSPLQSQCYTLVSNYSSYIPQLSSSLSNSAQLVLLVRSLENISNTVVPPDRIINDFNSFLNNLEVVIDQLVVNFTYSHFNPLFTNMISISNRINNYYSRISYGMPASQETVENFLGNEYLSNWKEFQYYATVAFSLALFVLVMGVALAVGRGLLNFGSIYMYGVDSSYIRSAHQAALNLKKLTLWMFVSGLVSSFFFLFVLGVAIVVGRACGRHGNFTELIREVIDNSSTWNDSYPLGSTYHSSPTYPLKLDSILSTCSMNVSSFNALQLQQLFELNKIFSGNISEHYITSMRLIPELVPVYSVLGTNFRSALLQYCNLNWSYHQLEELFESSFNGVSDLQDLIANLTSSLSQNSSLKLVQTLQDIDSALPTLANFSDWYDGSYLPADSHSLQLASILNSSRSLLASIDNSETKIQKKIYDIENNVIFRAALNVTERVDMLSSNAIHSISCTDAQCYPVAELYAQFSVSVCNNMLNGLDIYWMSLLVLFLTSLSSLSFMLLLAGRLFDKKNLPSYRGLYFSLTDRIISQSVSVLWLIVAFTVDTTLLVVIATDTTLPIKCTSCCITCLWGFGVVFLVLSFPLSIFLKIYEWVLLHRVRVYRGHRIQQLQRLWLTRIAATSFYLQLSLFFILYVPFLGISGGYTTNRGILTVSAFFSLLISLLGMSSFFLVLITERKNLMDYMNLLQQEAKNYCCFWKKRFVPAMPGNDTSGGVPNGRVQQDQGQEESHAMYTLQTTAPHMLPPVIQDTIEEEEEMGEEETSLGNEQINEGGGGQHEIPPPEIMPGALDDYPEPYHYEESELDEELPPNEEDQDKIPSLLLDRSTPDSSGFVRIRREEVLDRHIAGIEVAKSDSISTPRSSIYTSYDSVSGSYYHSTSQIPGYTSTDESSYKDGYDSNDSEYSYYLGQIKVEV